MIRNGSARILSWAKTPNKKSSNQLEIGKQNTIYPESLNFSAARISYRKNLLLKRMSSKYKPLERIFANWLNLSIKWSWSIFSPLLPCGSRHLRSTFWIWNKNERASNYRLLWRMVIREENSSTRLELLQFRSPLASVLIFWLPSLPTLLEDWTKSILNSRRKTTNCCFWIGFWF